MSASAFFPSDASTREARAARVTRTFSRELSGLLNRPEIEGASAVVTGQQVGLFLGPLFTYYKACTAIVAARALTEESGVPCVPVFWLQTEDHDVAEIASFATPGARLSLTVDGARISVGARVLGAEILPLVEELRASLAELPHAGEVMQIFAANYREGVPLSRAFAETLRALLPELIFVDPREPVIAELAKPIFRRALVEAEAIDRDLAARGEALRAQGFDEQVRPRPGSPLVFFHREGGERFRPEPGFSMEELLGILEREPLRFSTSALLRPLVQDSILPTAAYVGGPAEVAYLAQSSALYPRFGLEPPLVIPRARFRLVPPPAARLLEQLEVTPSQLEEGVRQIVAPGEDAPAPSWLAEIEARLSALPPHMARDAARARRSLRYAIDRLARRWQHHARERDATRKERLARLRSWLLPDGKPQERVYGVPWFAAQAGPRALAERVCAAIDPFAPTVKDLSL